MLFSRIVLVVLVGLSGALGALVRYLLGRFIAKRTRAVFPSGTFLINVTGSFLIGLIFSLAGQKLVSQTTQLLLATGFLGGYTTFSTMCWEGKQLLQDGSLRFGMLYLGGTLASGLLAAVLGLSLGRIL